MKKLRVLPACPMWPAITGYCHGSWVDTSLELHGEDGETPTHAHVYNYKRAAAAYPKLGLPDTVVTVSYEPDQCPRPWTVMLNTTKDELHVVKLGGEIPDFFEPLPEHVADMPTFETPEAGYAFIRDKYPHLQP